MGLTPRVSDLLGLRCGLRMCISIKFPGGADAASWGPHLENLWPRTLQKAPGTPQHPKDMPERLKTCSASKREAVSDQHLDLSLWTGF